MEGGGNRKSNLTIPMQHTVLTLSISSVDKVETRTDTFVLTCQN